MKSEIYIKQDDGKSRKIGYVKDKTFYTTRKKSKHFMKKLNAWGLDAETLIEIRLEYGVEEIVILDTESNKRYVAKCSDFDIYGNYLHFKPYKAQKFLEEKYWKVS